MQAREIALGIASAAIVAGGLVLLTRSPSDLPLPPVQPAAIEAAAPSDAPLTLAVAPAPSDDALIAAKVRELAAMSETYRNTTFVIAIRDAGYTCNELLRVYGGIDNSGKWTATCSEMLAYTVGVTGTGSLRVEPVIQYFDGLAPRVAPNETIVPVPPPRQ